MPVYRLLQNAPFGPDEIGGLVAAYDRTLSALGLTHRNDPITRLVASRIIAIARTGIRDSAELADLAIGELGCGPR